MVKEYARLSCFRRRGIDIHKHFARLLNAIAIKAVNFFCVQNMGEVDRHYLQKKDRHINITYYLSHHISNKTEQTHLWKNTAEINKLLMES